MSLNRLENAFPANKTALIPFIMAGYPDKKTSLEILCSLPEAGADIIELGMPFSDPVADGETIQQAGLKALEQGIKLADILEMVREFRKKDTKTSIVLMGYINPVYRYGAERFMKDAGTAGVDGMILVDLPIEEEKEFAEPAKENNIQLIHLISPVTPKERIAYVSKHSGGFLYYVSLTGITGSQAADTADIEQAVKGIHTHTDLPVGVGFGISTPEQAAKLKGKANAVIIGSAIIKKMDNDKPVETVKEFVKSIKAALTE